MTRRIGSVLTRLLRRDRADFREEREAELHLYVVSETSTLYLHLQSCWNSFVIVGRDSEVSLVLLDGCLTAGCLCPEVDPAPGPGLQEEEHAIVRLHQVGTTGLTFISEVN